MVIIEQIGYSQLDELLQILQRRAQWLMDIGKPMWDPMYLHKENFLRKYDNPLCFLAKNNNETIGGFILVEHDGLWKSEYGQGDAYYIHKLVIDIKHKGQGYVADIMRGIVSYAKRHHKKWLRLDYYADREYLSALYTELGFVVKTTLTMFDGTKICLAELTLQ